MRRRLYFVIPSVIEAEAILQELLLKRICINNIHVIARDDIDIGTLPEASILQKNDIKHSILVGLGAGLLVGIIGGAAFHASMGIPPGGGLIISMIIGAILGAWGASMFGLMIPNIQLRPFTNSIKKGKILMMVDVPKERIKEIKESVKAKHPQAHYKGVEPTIPSFP